MCVCVYVCVCVCVCVCARTQTSSGLKDCFMCEYLRYRAMGRILEPVYMRMKKKTPVENIRGRFGLS